MLPLFDILTTPKHLRNFSPTAPLASLPNFIFILLISMQAKLKYHNHTEITITLKLQLHKIKVTDTSHRSRYV